MTVPLGKPVRREVLIRRGVMPAWHVVSMTTTGVELREKGRRFVITVPWTSIVALGERMAGEDRHREALRTRALGRIRSAR